MSYELINTETLQQISQMIEGMQEKIDSLAVLSTGQPLIHTNKGMCALLGVSEKTLRKYRDECKIGFSKESDKFWYTQGDVDKFLANTHQSAFQYAKSVINGKNKVLTD